MTKDLWQQDDDTIETFLDRATRRLIAHGIIPMTDDSQNLPRYEQVINDLAEDLFEGNEK